MPEFPIGFMNVVLFESYFVYDKNMSIISFTIFDTKLFLNSDNGDIYDDEQFLIQHGIKFDEKSFVSNFRPSTYTFCLNISNSCNLRCSYCFNNKKDNYLMDKKIAVEKLNYLFRVFPDGEKYYVDLSGKGEPLINKSLISFIANYCMEKSNELRVEITPTLVCNGTLLSEENVVFLEKNRVLYGVSIDGPKEIHDLNRKDAYGNGTYDKIMENIKAIKNRDYVGVSATLTNNVFDLTQEIDYLSNFFKTISFRPARGYSYRINKISLDLWINEYEKLTLKLKEDIVYNSPKLFFCLINGDDFFGRFLYMAFGNLRSGNRCDYFIKRFTVDFDGKIYGCSAATMYKYLGRNQIENSIIKNELEKQFNTCRGCPYKYLCGGECQLEVNADLKEHAELCKLKQALINFAAYLKIYAIRNNPNFFKIIKDFCIEKMKRNKKNEELERFLKGNPNLDFFEAKKIYDERNKKY